jgi:hypothetical protein
MRAIRRVGLLDADGVAVPPQNQLVDLVYGPQAGAAGTAALDPVITELLADVTLSAEPAILAGTILRWPVASTSTCPGDPGAAADGIVTVLVWRPRPVTRPCRTGRGAAAGEIDCVRPQRHSGHQGRPEHRPGQQREGDSMTRSRRPITGAGPDELLITVWSPPGYRPENPDRVDAALRHLADVLNGLHGELEAAIGELSPRDIATLMSRAPLNERSHALRALGMPHLVPRTVGQALCRDMQTRLTRAHLLDARHAIQALTGPLHQTLLEVALASRGKHDPPVTASTGLRVEDCPGVLCRLTFWANVTAGVADARWITWAAHQPWWLLAGMSGRELQDLLTAAQAVIDASPDYQPADAPADSAGGASTTGTADPDGGQAASGAPDAPPITAALPPVSSPSAVSSPEEPGPMSEPTAHDEPLDLLASARHHREKLVSTQEAAVAAAHRLVADLEVGQCPARQDIATVTAFADGLEALTATLAGQTDGNPDGDRERPSLAWIDSTLEAWAQAVAADSTVARLTALSRLTVTGTNPALAEPLRQLGAALTRVLETDPDGPLVEALLALAELAELIQAVGPTHADPRRVVDLQDKVGTGLPPELAVLPVAVLIGQIVLGPADPAGPGPAAPSLADLGPADDGEPDHGASAASGEAASGEADADADPASGAPTADAGERAPAEDPASDRLARRRARRPGHGQADARSGGPTPGPRPTPAPTVPVRAAVTGAVSALVCEQRYGLAAAIALRAGWAAARVSALRLAALGEAVRGETGPSAARLRAELAQVDDHALAQETATLLLATPALLRAALITGDSTPGALLTALAPRLEANLGVIAEQVGRRALQGLLVGNPLRTVLADVTELETNLSAARAAAQDRLRPRTLRFKRATDIAHRWLAADGLLGRLLIAAAGDDRAQLGAVTAAVVRLADHDSLGKEIDTLDRRFKGHSGKSIEGSARQDLFALAADALAHVSAWLEAVATLEHATCEGAAWTTAELAEMRAAVLTHTDAALAALQEQTARDDALAGAAAVAARQSLAHTFALLDGSGTLAPGEPLPDVILTGELLKVPGAVVEVVSGLVALPEDVTVEALLDAAAVAWPAAFAAKLDAEEYPAADYLLAMVQAGTLPASGGLDAAAARKLAAAEDRSRAELHRTRERLSADLRRARLQNEISEEQDGELTGLLEAADPRRRDLNVVRAQLETVADLLPLYRQEAAHRLKERLRELAEQPTRVEVDVAKIQRLIDDGQLSTAEELIYFLEIGEPVPTVTPRDDLARFFPAVPDALPAGLTADVVAAARTGRVVEACPALDFTRLSADTRAEVADALDAWRAAGSTPAEGRAQLGVRAVLVSALRVAGFEFQAKTRAQSLDVQKGRERRFVELTEVSWNGRATVPQFGSKLGGRLRVLLCWGQPAEDLLMSWADQDTSGEAILVAHFGTMSAGARQGLAARAVRTDAPVIVLDDASLAYLAAHGGRQVDAAMAILLPFAAVQPYARHKRSLVAPEMFYGRDSERKAVLSPEGTQVIFGGRGLGKSALLRDAKAVFEREPGRVAIHIELTTTEIGPDKQSADAVWDVLLRDLETAGVITTPRAARRGRSSHEIVRAGVLDWLSADGRHRLLILLDESDGFFETDAPRFLETNRLKDLGQLSGVEGRAKVVFAGLHSVQRFTKMSNNTFKHLAQRPTVIGPLPPQFAYNLIARPMEALGYSFADADLVNRILGYCSYQPFLLQMFGHRLVEHMQSRRESGVSQGQPPFLVTRADVETVESDPDLKADIASTFSDTLNLDQRYNVIANVLAWHAHDRSMDARLTDVQLREECRSWWAAGFDNLNAEAFRAYLHEMVGLGVLAPNNDGSGWHPRSPNVLRMIGSQDQVMSELVHASSAPVPSEFIALATRRVLPDGSRAPLTAGQVDDLLGDHVNQVRLVLGSAATGVEKVSATMRAVCTDLAGRYTLVEARGRKTFEDELIAGRPGERRVLLSDLLAMDTKDAACVTALEDALHRRPGTPGVTRSAVIVSATAHLGFWQRVFTQGERHGLGVVSLRRFDRRTLRVWSLDTGRFATDERQARLLAVTSGWPLLVEQVVEAEGAHQSEDRALDQLQRQLDSPEGAGAFIDAVGLTGDASLANAFEHITALADACASISDLTEAAALSGHPEPAAAVAAMDALGVFDVGDDGAYRVDPLLVRCWPFRRLPFRGDA